MPVKLGAKLPPESAEARIEIIPLIDIMFFLLASFMLASLSMVNLRAIKVNLPTAVSARTDTKKDFDDISVDKAGGIFLDKNPVGDTALARQLAADRRVNPNLRVLISGDRDTLEGRMAQVLEAVRGGGVQKVAFMVGGTETKGAQ